MVLESLKEKNINLPIVGGVSLLAVSIVGIAFYFLLKRKKSISLKF